MDFSEFPDVCGWEKLNNSEKLLAFKNFNEDYYISKNLDISFDDFSAFFHFVTIGWKEGRDPNKYFKIVKYIIESKDSIGPDTNPFFHYLFPEKLSTAAINEHPLDVAIADAIDLNLPQLADACLVDLNAQDPTPVTPSSVEQAFYGLSENEIKLIRNEFDADYYISKNEKIKIYDVDPFLHFMTQGWKENLNPSENFSTKYYLNYNIDIAQSGMNPFVHWVLHGKEELRRAISFHQSLKNKPSNPTVSAIVPNFNHGKFLAQRIDSILNQSYTNINITILDDCSTDNSREIIDQYVEKYPSKIKKIYNDVNSGSVFSQWEKGVNQADGEIIWICESDDFCEPDFVEKLVPYFVDDSVQIAFGRILETDIEGVPNLWLDTYRERAEAGIWETSLVRPAAHWFAHAFGVSNVIANVGGSLWRRSPVPASVWEEAATYHVVGDWYLYLQIAGGGQIAWEPKAVAYFRRHGSNTSSKALMGTGFYAELERFMIELRKYWNVSDSTVINFYNTIINQYEFLDLENKIGKLENYCDINKIISIERTKPHVLISMLGFIPGGGENFPIQLANSLIESGWLVSMLIFESHEVNEHMRASLNPAISVYHADWVLEYGCTRFIREAGISLIHSHTVGSEMRFYQMWNLDPKVPYIVTLHGSYEASDLPHDVLETMTRSVNHFIYTAEKNLIPFKNTKIDPEMFTKMANAMPIDPLPFPDNREQMGIADDAVVFTLVARGIKRKGWRAAIEAFGMVRARHPEQAMHLCLVGEGDEPDRHQKIHGTDPDISFLGYQSRIHGLYRMSDVAIVPTRFSGESYPLCIIQALQVGTPVVASDAGEISNMLQNEAGVRGGIVVKAVRDTESFIASFADAMEEMLDENKRNDLAIGAKEIGLRYDMEPLVNIYEKIYSRVLSESGDFH